MFSLESENLQLRVWYYKNGVLDKDKNEEIYPVNNYEEAKTIRARISKEYESDKNNECEADFALTKTLIIYIPNPKWDR